MRAGQRGRPTIGAGISCRVMWKAIVGPWIAKALAGIGPGRRGVGNHLSWLLVSAESSIRLAVHKTMLAVLAAENKGCAGRRHALCEVERGLSCCRFLYMPGRSSSWSRSENGGQPIFTFSARAVSFRAIVVAGDRRGVWPSYW